MAGWPQDVKSFEFEVLESKNIEFEGVNILGPSVRLAGWHQDVKSFEFELLGSKNLEFEVLTSWGHLAGLLDGPRMLKASNSSSWAPKTSNSKVLTS